MVKRATWAVTAALMTCTALTSCQAPNASDGAGTSRAVDNAAAGGSAVTVLATLPVRPDQAISTYKRVADFGPAWTDNTSAPGGHNGCDTRDDILRRDLTTVQLHGPCEVESGTLHDPYTGKTIAFHRGRGTSEAVQIDHMVALGNAWQTGAAALPQATREELANDPLNLEAVDGPANEAKGDDDAANWLPPSNNFRCAYVARQIAVKLKYRLWVTTAEKQAMQNALGDCHDQTVPTESSSGVALTP